MKKIEVDVMPLLAITTAALHGFIQNVKKDPQSPKHSDCRQSYPKKVNKPKRENPVSVAVVILMTTPRIWGFFCGSKK